MNKSSEKDNIQEETPLESVDCQAKAHRQGGWKLVNLSHEGSSHKLSNRGCDDFSLTYYDNEKDLIIAVVSDGAGGYEGTNLGSQAVCEEFADEIRKNLSLFNAIKTDNSVEESNSKSMPNDYHDKLLNLLKRVRKNAAQKLKLSTSADQLCATISGIILYNGMAYIFHIGDGHVFIEDEKGYLEVTSPQHGEYANETYFINSDKGIQGAEIIIRCAVDINKFLLSTDGLKDVLLSEGKANMDTSEVLFKHLSEVAAEDFEKELSSFFQSDMITNCTDDDLSLVLGMRDKT